jgi:WD40 repeat protein
MIGRINVYNRNYLRVKKLYFPSKCTVIDTTDNIAALGGRRNLGFIDTRSYEYIKLSYSPRIVGMKWSPDKNYVLIGYHDNFIKVLDIRKTFDQNSYIFEDTSYNAAIKGMDWIDSNSFVTGGGTGDHTVRLYDFSKKRLIDKMDTRSQITGIVMNKSKKEMIISHGFSAKGLIKVRINNFKLVKKGEILDYHEDRITSMVISPDRTKIATVSRDEILKVGKVFEKSICKKPMLFENKKHRFVLR